MYSTCSLYFFRFDAVVLNFEFCVWGYFGPHTCTLYMYVQSVAIGLFISLWYSKIKTELEKIMTEVLS